MRFIRVDESVVVVKVGERDGVTMKRFMSHYFQKNVKRVVGVRRRLISANKQVLSRHVKDKM